MTLPTSITPVRARQFTALGTGLGIKYLATGAAPIAALQLVYGLTLVVWNWESYPSILLVCSAWALLFASLTAVAVLILVRGERMPTWMFVGLLCALGAAVALDLISIWPLHNVGASASAAVCAGSGLLIAVTLRSSRDIVGATIGLGSVLILAILINTPLTPHTVPTQLIAVAMAVAPPLIGAFTLRRFRRILATELDRVLVQSTVTAPQFTLGMLASEELARLDLAAEQLLESVADGTCPLPLSPETASDAASLATELRLHLIENRRETWLYHAITESDQLGRSVTLSDPHTLAGMLTPEQRDGLFSAVWLLVADRVKTAPHVEISLNAAIMHAADLAFGTICIPISVEVTGLFRNRFDSSVVSSFQKVGHFTQTADGSTTRLEIRCIVESPGRQ